MVEEINGYRLLTKFTTSNAGMCQWAFAKKGEKEYFIKQLLYPKYPIHSEKLSPRLVSAMQLQAETFYSERQTYYQKLCECRTGNNVLVQDFFRFKSDYYVVSERVHGPFLTVEQIAAMPQNVKFALLKAITFNLIPIHDRGIVHSDLKTDNILVKNTSAGFCTAKLIDFEAGFFIYKPPEEIEGDQVFFSPEVMLWNDEEETKITDKADVFALGLLFHLYWCGHLPLYDSAQYISPSVALLNHDKLRVDDDIPAGLCCLIERMLSLRQEERPGAREVHTELLKLSAAPVAEAAPIPTAPPVTGEKFLLGTLLEGSGAIQGFRAPSDDDLW